MTETTAPRLPAATDAEAPALASRRHFVQSSGAIGLGLLGAPDLAGAAVLPLEAYASATSVRQGANIDFHVRDPGGSLTADTIATVAIVRLAGWVDHTMATSLLPVRNRAVPADAYSRGCHWPVSYGLTIPAAWPSGLYYAFFLGATGTGCCVPFVVRPATATAGVKALVLVPASTAQAENDYGLAAIGGVPNGKMSFDRPLSYRFNYAFDIRQAILARWLDRRGVKADFCTCVDLHQEADLLKRYQLLMVAGEYSHWTMAQRAQFDAFVAAGGNAALLGARSCQWQSRLEPSAGTGTANRVLVCYRSASADPDQRPEYKTVPWNTLGTSVHSAQSVGLSSEGPVYGGTGARPAIAYRVNAPHWIFEGTGLKPGDTFGEGIAGPKLDTLYPTVMLDGAGVEVSKNCSVVPGRFLPQRNAAWPVPEMATIVASVSATGWGRWSLSLPPQPRYDNSYAFMAVFSRAGAAGTVFNAGTLDWVAGLQPEVQGGPATAVGKITANLITRLSGAAHRESAEIRRYFLYDIPQSDRYELAIGDTRTLARIRDSNGNIGDDSYRLEQLRGYLCRGYLSQVAGTVPVYRFFVEDFDRQVYRRYRYSLSPAVSPGWTPDGIAFYAYASPVPGSEPVYSWYSIGSARFASDATGWRFFYTRSPTNPSAGLCESDNTPWVFGNVAFHAPKV